MPKARVLVVEDEKDISELIQYNLKEEGYAVIQAYDGQEALDLVYQEKPDLIILDIMLPEIDGKDICKALKRDEKTQSIPIIMLTAKSEESDVVLGLELGADDYIIKPFSPKILLARVKAILRRIKEDQTKGEVRKREELTIDMLKHKVSYKGKNIDLTPIEFNIIEFLSKSPGRVYSRDQIMDGAWKEGKFIVDRAVDVHIRSLRKKLGKGSKIIETVHGFGYRFQDVNSL